MDKHEERVLEIMAMIRHRYGEGLTESEMEEVKKNADSMVNITEAFIDLPLGNGIEPYSVFTPVHKKEAAS